MSAVLPIEEIKADLLAAVVSTPLILLTAPPGAGKSTVLPLWLLKQAAAQKSKIYLLQPRRVAAKNIALYLAQQLNEPVGKTVGYRLRNESKVSENTIIEVITEGILTRIMQQDPEMLGCNLIIFDEFHERSVQADLAFAIARDIQQGLRDNLTIMLMSATMAIESIKEKLPDAKLLACNGRSFPISYAYQAPDNIRHWRLHALNQIQQKLLVHNGSILVFLPSAQDIRWLASQLVESVPAKFNVTPLYGNMSLAEQQKAIKPLNNGQFKLVLATNIAETSLTIEGINLVIDSGLEKVACFDHNSLTNQLIQQNICKASAIQRAGRAGRIMAGECLRLYSEEDFHRRPEQAKLSIEQTDLLPLLITAANWGVTRLDALPLLDFPNPLLEEKAWHTLQLLGIVDDKNKLTLHGQQVAQLSCHPRFAHMIIKAQEIVKRVTSNTLNSGPLSNDNNGHNDHGLMSLACLLAATLEEKDIFAGESQFNSDISLRIKAIVEQAQQSKQQALVKQILQQASQLAKQTGIRLVTKLSTEYCGLLLSLAYPERLAKARTTNGEYLAANGKGMTLRESDSLNNHQYLVVANASQYQQQLTIRMAADVSIEQLIAYKIVNVDETQQLEYDEKLARIVAKKVMKIGAITLSQENDSELLSADKVSLLWCKYITEKGLAVLKWQAQDQALLARLQWLSVFQNVVKLADFPDFSEAFLLNNLHEWLAPYVGECHNKSALNKLDLSSVLLARLTYQQQQLLNQLAPAYFLGPTGRKCPISYTKEKSPIVSLPMQEVYGLADSPTVGSDEYTEKIALTLSLLSPAGRPIQLTQDLAGFWQGSYKEVQKEMKGRYPKHYWPDDPANAKATAKTKKYM